jgi:hypothetical protein
MSAPDELYIVGEKPKRQALKRFGDVLLSKNITWGDGLEVQIHFKDDLLGTDIGKITISAEFEDPPYKPWWKFW